MERQKLNTADARISSLETAVDNITKAVAGLAVKLDGLSDSLSKSHRWDWASIWGGVACLLVVIGAVGQSYIAPIYSKFDFLSKDFQETKLELNRLRDTANLNRGNIEKHAALFAAKLTEIETQFDWLNDIVNMRDRNASLLTAMLWEKAYQRPLPQPTLPNAGPGANDQSRADYNGEAALISIREMLDDKQYRRTQGTP